MRLLGKHHVFHSGLSEFVANVRTFHAHEDPAKFMNNMLNTVDSVEIFRRYTSDLLFKTEAYYAVTNQEVRSPRFAFIKGDSKQTTNSREVWFRWIEDELYHLEMKRYGFHK